MSFLDGGKEEEEEEEEEDNEDQPCPKGLKQGPKGIQPGLKSFD